MITVLAHGLTSRADLPIPEWLFGWVAAIVLVISFVSLGVLWRRPMLADYRTRALPHAVSRALTSQVTEVVCGAIGVALLILVFWAGFAGVQSSVGNIVPTFVYVVFWIGLVLVSVLFGDVLRAFNPWRAIGRAVAALGSRYLGESLGTGFAYPQWLAYWPAAAGVFAFGWIELLSPDGTAPRSIAAAALAYTSVTFLGMGMFGVETWCARGEAYGVYFGLFSRLSCVERRGREIVLRPPLTGIASLLPTISLVPMLAVMIGVITFDGFQETSIASDTVPEIASFFRSIGAGPALGDELGAGVAMLTCCVAVAGFFLLGIAGARTAEGSQDRAEPDGAAVAGRGRPSRPLGRHTKRELAGAFVPSLVPIALVYVLAHYITFFLFQGQAMFSLISDPLGKGWDLFGTVGTTIDYTLIGASVTWYLQVAVVVAGHCAALALAHDRALELYDDPRVAVRSQYWMLAVMIGFTSLALWLLSQANA
jgi:hypothetical protein